MNEDDTLPPRPAKKPHLVPEWKRSWRWFSVQLASLMAIMPVVYEYAEAFQGLLSESAFRKFMAVLGLLTIIARVVKQ